MSQLIDQGVLHEFSSDRYIVVHPSDMHRAAEILHPHIRRLYGKPIDINVHTVDVGGQTLVALSSADPNFFFGQGEFPVLKDKVNHVIATGRRGLGEAVRRIADLNRPDIAQHLGIEPASPRSSDLSRFSEVRVSRAAGIEIYEYRDPTTGERLFANSPEMRAQQLDLRGRLPDGVALYAYDRHGRALGLYTADGVFDSSRYPEPSLRIGANRSNGTFSPADDGLVVTRPNPAGTTGTVNETIHPVVAPTSAPLPRAAPGGNVVQSEFVLPASAIASHTAANNKYAGEMHDRTAIGRLSAAENITRIIESMTRAGIAAAVDVGNSLTTINNLAAAARGRTVQSAVGDGGMLSLVIGQDGKVTLVDYGAHGQPRGIDYPKNPLKWNETSGVGSKPREILSPPTPTAVERTVPGSYLPADGTARIVHLTFTDGLLFTVPEGIEHGGDMKRHVNARMLEMQRQAPGQDITLGHASRAIFDEELGKRLRAIQGAVEEVVRTNPGTPVEEIVRKVGAMNSARTAKGFVDNASIVALDEWVRTNNGQITASSLTGRQLVASVNDGMGGEGDDTRRAKASHAATLAAAGIVKDHGGSAVLSHIDDSVRPTSSHINALRAEEPTPAHLAEKTPGDRPPLSSRIASLFGAAKAILSGSKPSTPPVEQAVRPIEGLKGSMVISPVAASDHDRRYATPDETHTVEESHRRFALQRNAPAGWKAMQLGSNPDDPVILRLTSFDPADAPAAPGRVIATVKPATLPVEQAVRPIEGLERFSHRQVFEIPNSGLAPTKVYQYIDPTTGDRVIAGSVVSRVHPLSIHDVARGGKAYLYTSAGEMRGMYSNGEFIPGKIGGDGHRLPQTVGQVNVGDRTFAPSSNGGIVVNAGDRRLIVTPVATTPAPAAAPAPAPPAATTPAPAAAPAPAPAAAPAPAPPAAPAPASPAAPAPASPQPRIAATSEVTRAAHTAHAGNVLGGVMLVNSVVQRDAGGTAVGTAVLGLGLAQTAETGALGSTARGAIDTAKAHGRLGQFFGALIKGTPIIGATLSGVLEYSNDDDRNAARATGRAITSTAAATGAAITTFGIASAAGTAIVTAGVGVLGAAGVVVTAPAWVPAAAAVVVGTGIAMATGWLARTVYNAVAGDGTQTPRQPVASEPGSTQTAAKDTVTGPASPSPVQQASYKGYAAQAAVAEAAKEAPRDAAKPDKKQQLASYPRATSRHAAPSPA